MMPILIIADDLTGAADTGAMFCSAVGPVDMVGPDSSQPPSAAMTVHTDSRHLRPDPAAKAVSHALNAFGHAPSGLVYKKIDSCLRGNIGAEIDALLQTGRFKAAIIAPAFPEQGRTTLNDVHYLNSWPIASTEMSRDPRHPITQSSLSATIAAQTGLPAAHVNVSHIERGMAHMQNLVRGFMACGYRHITCDATSQRHLHTLAQLVMAGDTTLLPVGSAGLAKAMAALMPPFQQTPRLPDIEKLLFICGSAAKTLHTQLDRLREQLGCGQQIWQPDTLLATEPLPAAIPIADWKANAYILRISPIDRRGPARDPDTLVNALARQAIELVQKARPEGLALSGGDTAQAVLTRLGAHTLRLRQIVCPGIVYGQVVGGIWNNLNIFTKAGAFGKPNALVELYRSLMERNQHAQP